MKVLHIPRIHLGISGAVVFAVICLCWWFVPVVMAAVTVSSIVVLLAALWPEMIGREIGKQHHQKSVKESA